MYYRINVALPRNTISEILIVSQSINKQVGYDLDYLFGYFNNQTMSSSYPNSYLSQILTASLSCQSTDLAKRILDVMNTEIALRIVTRLPTAPNECETDPNVLLLWDNLDTIFEDTDAGGFAEQQAKDVTDAIYCSVNEFIKQGTLVRVVSTSINYDEQELFGGSSYFHTTLNLVTDE